MLAATLRKSKSGPGLICWCQKVVLESSMHLSCDVLVYQKLYQLNQCMDG